MEIIDDWVDEEFYFDLKLTPSEIVAIADGKCVTKQFKLKEQKINFTILRKDS